MTTFILTGTETGRFNDYSPSPGDRWFAADWNSTAIGNGESIAVMLGDAYGKSDALPVIDSIWRGGRIVGSIPPSDTWETCHDVGGGGIKSFQAGPFAIEYLRVHNVEDGIKPRETTTGLNKGSFRLVHSYFSAVRDDICEDDAFIPGVIAECLFDGCFAGFSEQNQNEGSFESIGPNERRRILLKNVAARLDGNVNGSSSGPGALFKLQPRYPGVVNHQIISDGCTYALSEPPTSGWGSWEFPADIILRHTNTICWLGPGDYPGKVPPGVRVLTSKTTPTASHRWITVRNKWLTNHDLPASAQPATVNPHDIEHATSIPTPAF